MKKDGHFKVASIMSETQGSLQVESVSGKRTKVKANNILMRFESNLADFFRCYQSISQYLRSGFYVGMLRRSRVWLRRICR